MQLYLRAISYFKRDWPLITVWLLLIGISTLAGLLVAWPMAVLMDSVFSSTVKDTLANRVFLSILPRNPVGQIIGLALIGLGIKVMQDALGVLQTIVSNKIQYNGLLRVRCDLFHKLQSLDISFHRSQPQGDAIYRLSSDTFGCQNILQVVVNAAVAVVTLAIMTWILLSRSVTLTLLAFSVAPILAITNVMYGRILFKRSLECREMDAKFTTTIQQSMSCIGLVQVFGREQREFGKFSGSVRDLIGSWWRFNWQQWTYNMIIGTAFGIGGAVIFGYGGFTVYRDQCVNHNPHGMTVGDLLIFTQYLAMLWGPLCTLTGFYGNLLSGAAGVKRVFEVLDRPELIADAPDASSLPQKARTLELDHVRFSYGVGKPVLRDVSAKIRPGEMVAFVGSSGAGKSTVLNLLPRLYDVQGGAVRLDGVDIRTVKLRDLRKHIALVLQENVMLPASIAENIAYGRPDATGAEIRHAAKLAMADEFIEEMPQGYATVLAEGGSNLSGGQRQRIAIARALLTEAPIIVMDEPTSALDPQHEQLVTHSLRSLQGQRTIVIVSHRLTTVADCDRIVVMRDGQIVEHGTHGELLERGGMYYEMTRGEMELPETNLELPLDEDDAVVAA